MPLAYPFGAGQPLGCNICGPAAEVSPFATGTTASVGPFDVLTNHSPSLQGFVIASAAKQSITFLSEPWIASLRSQ
jgi:hypothetical protein